MFEGISVKPSSGNPKWGLGREGGGCCGQSVRIIFELVLPATEVNIFISTSVHPLESDLS